MQTKTIYKKNIYNGHLILVNQDHPVSPEFELSLVYMNATTNHKIHPKVYQLLHQCMDHLNDHQNIVLTSGYRSQYEQESLYKESLHNNGEEYTNQFVAKPTHSEHETGLAFDLALRSSHIDEICPDFPYNGVCQKFRELCYDYGFIERYGEYKQSITHISKEPWHFRYVGFPHSLIMKEKDMCLEEYHDFLKEYSIYKPYTYVVNQRVFDIYYVPVSQKTTIALRSEDVYQISGNNMDGVIVTVWRRCL